jgi:hypothetical protein
MKARHFGKRSSSPRPARRLCTPFKCAAYHAWHQDLPPPDDSGFDQEFESLIGDRFFIGSADELPSRFCRSIAGWASVTW